MSRFARFAANIRFNIYGQALQVALPLLFLPFILRHLGREAYALYGLIGVLTSQLNLLNFGTNEATVKYLAEFEAAGDRPKMDRLLGNSLAFCGSVGLFGALLLTAATPYVFAPLPWLGKKLIDIGPDLVPAARCVLWCGAGVFLARTLAKTFHSIPQALQRFDVWNSAETGLIVLTYAGIYGLLSRGFGLRTLAVWTVVVAIANLILYAWLGQRLVPGLRLRPAYDPEMMRKVVGFGGWQLLGHAGWSVLNQLDKLLLYHYIPLGDMAYYLIACNVSQKMLSLLGPALPILLPLASTLHGKGDYATARKFYLSGTKLTVILIWPAAVLAFFFGPSFLEIWLGGNFSEHSGWVMRVLILGSFVSTIGIFGGQISQGFGRLSTPTLISVGCAGLGAASWFWVMPRYGALGTACVYLVVQVLMAALFTTWCNRSLLQIREREFSAALLRPLLVSLPLIAACCWLRNSLKGWVELGLFGALAYSACLGLCYRFALNPEERRRVLSLKG